MTLTKRQHEVVGFLWTYYRKHGIMPSLTEIGAAFGICKTGALEHLWHLERKGVIRRHKGEQRAIEFRPQWRRALRDRERMERERCGPAMLERKKVVGWLLDQAQKTQAGDVARTALRLVAEKIHEGEHDR